MKSKERLVGILGTFTVNTSSPSPIKDHIQFGERRKLPVVQNLFIEKIHISDLICHVRNVSRIFHALKQVPLYS